MTNQQTNKQNTHKIDVFTSPEKAEGYKAVVRIVNKHYDHPFYMSVVPAVADKVGWELAHEFEAVWCVRYKSASGVYCITADGNIFQATTSVKEFDDGTAVSSVERAEAEAIEQSHQLPSSL